MACPNVLCLKWDRDEGRRRGTATSRGQIGAEQKELPPFPFTPVVATGQSLHHITGYSVHQLVTAISQHLKPWTNEEVFRRKLTGRFLWWGKDRNGCNKKKQYQSWEINIPPKQEKETRIVKWRPVRCVCALGSIRDCQLILTVTSLRVAYGTFVCDSSSHDTGINKQEILPIRVLSVERCCPER
jgi:hypothetical protein